MTFKERAELGLAMLKQQEPVTLEEAREQAKWLKETSKSEDKKK